MKKKTFTKTILLFTIILLSQNYLQAQILDVAPFDADGNPQLAEVIKWDTLADGSRVLDRVYRLERGEIYLMTSTINARYDVRIIAGGDESMRPPMIISGKSVTGSNIRPFFKLKGDGTTNYFKNIFFNGVDLERSYDGEWFQALIMEGDDMSTSFEGCVFNAFTGGATNFSGASNSIYFRDCIWRNGVWSTHPFVGQQVTMPALQIDTLIVTNCTYFNTNSFWLFQEKNLALHTIIEHNTVFTSLIDMMRLRITSNTNIRSNLFYGTHAFGDTPESRDATWFEPDKSAYSVISIYEAPAQVLSDANMTEETRVIELTHNAWFTPQAIRDYWDSDASISPLTFMNDRTKGLFTDGGHPYFRSENNVEKDPLFTNIVMHDWVVGKVAEYCTKFRATDSKNGHALDGSAGETRNYDAQQGVDILTDIQWPLPETLEYSDADLLIGGHDGLPVGDLNWHTEKRELYVEPDNIGQPVSTIDVHAIEISVFPNPATDLLHVTSAKEFEKLEVFNLLGKRMLQRNIHGQSDTRLNISVLPNGVYMLFVSSGKEGGSMLFVKQ